MAKVSIVLFKLLCFTFCFIIRVNSKDTDHDGSSIYNYYNTYPELKQNSHIAIVHLSKRDVPLQKPPTPIDTNRSERIMQSDTSPKTKSSSSSSNSGPLKNQTIYIPDTKKLLGVNGTGQRHSYDEGKNGKTLLETLEKAAPKTVLNKQVTTSTANVTEATTTMVPSTSPATSGGAGNNMINIDEIMDEDDTKLNKTLISHNITNTTIEDDHGYYTSTFSVNREMGMEHWIFLENRTDVKISELLSQSHRRAATVKLSFDFPFYGHLIRNVTIATGGFLYTGQYVHSWLAATQYIAPLMANFDTSLSNDSFVKYVDNGTAFTVQWEKVSLKDRPNDGEFTFQVTLHHNGDIVFVYKDVPLIITEIKDDQHPVKVGLSDAYIIDRQIFYVRRKTIYEYHRVHFTRDDIKNWTTIYLRALPTCMTQTNCSSCLTAVTNFSCKWCITLDRCSSGVDRNRQEWIQNKCDQHYAANVTECSKTKTAIDIISKNKNDHNDDNNNVHHNDDDYNSLENAERAPRVAHSLDAQQSHSNSENMNGVSTLLGVFIITLISSAIGWMFYAYRNPHTSSGQFLIRYRPSTWSWRRGEARYTAATIHM